MEGLLGKFIPFKGPILEEYLLLFVRLILQIVNCVIFLLLHVCMWSFLPHLRVFACFMLFLFPALYHYVRSLPFFSN